MFNHTLFLFSLRISISEKNPLSNEMQSGKDIYDFPDFEGVYETIVEQTHSSSVQNEIHTPQPPVDNEEMSVINTYYMPVDSIDLSVPPIQGVGSGTYNSLQTPSPYEMNGYSEPPPEVNDYCELHVAAQTTELSVAGTYYIPVDLKLHKDSASTPEVGMSNGSALGYQNLMLLSGTPLYDEGLMEGESEMLQKNSDDSQARGCDKEAGEGDVEKESELPLESVRLSASNTYATPRPLAQSSGREGESEHFMENQHGSQAKEHKMTAWEEDIKRKGAYQELYVMKASENEYESLKVQS